MCVCVCVFFPVRKEDKKNPIQSNPNLLSLISFSHLAHAIRGKDATAAVLDPIARTTDMLHRRVVSSLRAKRNSTASPSTTEKEGILNFRSPVTSGTSFGEGQFKGGGRKGRERDPLFKGLFITDSCIQEVIHGVFGVCVCVCVFIKLHITTQSGPVILVILCHSH